MVEIPMDQSILKEKYYKVVFEGKPAQFIEVMLVYASSHKIEVNPYRWTQSPNKKGFSLEKDGPSSAYRPVLVYLSPLPGSKTMITFQIPEYNFDEYSKICNLFVDYIREQGWIIKDKYQDNPHTDLSISVKHKKSDCPKKSDTLSLYKKINDVIVVMENDYAIKFAAGATTAPKPLESDIAQTLEIEFGKPISERTIRRVKRCAKERGWKSL